MRNINCTQTTPFYMRSLSNISANSPNLCYSSALRFDNFLVMRFSSSVYRLRTRYQDASLVLRAPFQFARGRFITYLVLACAQYTAQSLHFIMHFLAAQTIAPTFPIRTCTVVMSVLCAAFYIIRITVNLACFLRRI